MSSEWKRRIRLFIQRFWQPTTACMTCMPGSWGNVASTAHWIVALQTGLLTGILAVALTFTPAAKLYVHRYGNALAVGVLTMLGDAYAHANHFRIPFGEAVRTGLCQDCWRLPPPTSSKTGPDAFGRYGDGFSGSGRRSGNRAEANVGSDGGCVVRQALGADLGGKWFRRAAWRTGRRSVAVPAQLMQSERVGLQQRWPVSASVLRTASG